MHSSAGDDDLEPLLRFVVSASRSVLHHVLHAVGAPGCGSSVAPTRCSACSIGRPCCGTILPAAGRDGGDSLHAGGARIAVVEHDHHAVGAGCAPPPHTPEDRPLCQKPPSPITVMVRLLAEQQRHRLRPRRAKPIAQDGVCPRLKAARVAKEWQPMSAAHMHRPHRASARIFMAREDGAFRAADAEAGRTRRQRGADQRLARLPGGGFLHHARHPQRVQPPCRPVRSGRCRTAPPRAVYSPASGSTFLPCTALSAAPPRRKLWRRSPAQGNPGGPPPPPARRACRPQKAVISSGASGWVTFSTSSGMRVAAEDDRTDPAVPVSPAARAR